MITKETLAKAKEAAVFNQTTLDAWVDTAKRSYEPTEDFICANPKEWALTIQAKIGEGYRVAEEYFPVIHAPSYYSIRMTKPEAVQAQELEQVVIEATASYYEAIERDKDAYARLSAEYVVQEAVKKAAAAEEQRKAKLYEESFKKALAELQENV